MNTNHPSGLSSLAYFDHNLGAWVAIYRRDHNDNWKILRSFGDASTAPEGAQINAQLMVSARYGHVRVAMFPACQ